MTQILPHTDHDMGEPIRPQVVQRRGVLSGVIGLLAFFQNMLRGVLGILLLVVGVIVGGVLVYLTWRAGEDAIEHIDRWFGR